MEGIESRLEEEELLEIEIENECEALEDEEIITEGEEAKGRFALRAGGGDPCSCTQLL